MRPPRPLVPTSVRVLQPMVDAGILDAGEVAVADAVARLQPEGTDDLVTLGVAIAALGRRLGHSCVDLASVAEMCTTASENATPEAVKFPPVPEWVAALDASTLVQVGEPDDAAWERPLVLAPEQGRLWLSRYAFYEQTLCARLVERVELGEPFGSDEQIATALATAFGGDVPAGSDRQRDAAAAALRRRCSFITGGPGTGKTWTVGRLIEAVRALDEYEDSPRVVALAAPTGKAAERLTEAVGGGIVATTLHRLLGMYPGKALGVDTAKLLPHDLVVVDEASMIDLAMMTHLLGALKLHAHVVFVGDPDQLLSVEVGSVLRDVVDAAGDGPTAPLAGTVTAFEQGHRFTGPIGELADAVRRGDSDAVWEVLADADRPEVSLVVPNDSAAVTRLAGQVVEAAQTMVEAARRGDVDTALKASKDYKVLTATRSGPFGLGWWNERIAQAHGFHVGQWAPGRPVIVTRNDPANGVFNGDTGIVVPGPDGAHDVRVAFSGPDGPRLVAPSRLRSQEDWWAMTIHKSQGSEFDHVVVSLPRDGSPILSRELLYTAVTRAKQRVTILGSEQVVRAATEHRVDRASGLRERLAAP